jgi:hypothetical protein
VRGKPRLSETEVYFAGKAIELKAATAEQLSEALGLKGDDTLRKRISKQKKRR